MANRIFLHYDIYNASRDNDDFLDGVAGKVLSGVLVREDEFLYFLFRGVFRALEGETHFAVELNRVFLAVLYEVRLVALRPGGIYHKLCEL